MKLTVALTALAVLALPATAQAQEEPAACSPGYELVISAGGPLCVNPIYLTGWEDDPATCTNGFYQGSCVPDEYAESPPVVFEPAAYEYQPITVAAAVEVVRRVADDVLCLVQRPC